MSDFTEVFRAPGLVVERRPTWLRVRLDAPHAMLGFPVLGGVRSVGQTILWHEVRNAELAQGVDPIALLRARASALGEAEAPTFMTSRALEHVHARHFAYGDPSATAIATVGLGNALRAGDTPGDCTMVGTINVLCRVSHALTEAAMLEALSLVVEARTLAINEASVPSRRSGARASGTGTDCVIVAAPREGDPLPYAGKHTALGHTIGLAVREAVYEGAARWKETTGWR